MFAGYAGWGEGQLDAELSSGDWITAPATPEDVFTEVPEQLWTAALERKGGSYALLARMPDGPEPELSSAGRRGPPPWRGRHGSAADGGAGPGVDS